MRDRCDLPGELFDLFDAYCSGLIDDDGLRRLEEGLLASADARRQFVAYFQMHTDLEFEARARRAASAVLDRVVDGNVPQIARAARAIAKPKLLRAPLRLNRWSAVAAGLLMAVIGFAFGLLGRQPVRPLQQPRSVAAASPTGANVAWLVNAQDCQWVGDESGKPGRDMRVGKILRLQSGLAEIQFDQGARLILQGPAGLELRSGNEARLLHGALTARVPPEARGFTVVSPRGKVVDLGTEFGLSVDDRGNTAVHVFAGEVEATPLADGAVRGAHVTLVEDQSARINGRTVSVEANGESAGNEHFVRAIEPPPLIVPRMLSLDFLKSVSGSLQDRDGRGIGLTHRLPGTGAALAERDPNLRLDVERGVLQLTTTRSDINQQDGMPTGEYPGLRLSNLGFTGLEDFAVSATIPDIPGLAVVGQFGLYVGPKSDKNIRGGLISLRQPDRYELFLVNNNGGDDSDTYRVGLINTGDDLRLTLRRIAGKYSLVVENLTTKSSGTLTIAHPAFLDGERDMYVGFFGANTQSNVRKTLTIKELGVTVWTISQARESPPGSVQATARLE